MMGRRTPQSATKNIGSVSAAATRRKRRSETGETERSSEPQTVTMSAQETAAARRSPIG